VQFLGPLQNDLDVSSVIDSRRSQFTMYRLQPSIWDWQSGREVGSRMTPRTLLLKP
jgi:hypothetical protein